MPPSPNTYNPIAQASFPVGTPVSPLSLAGQVGTAFAGSITKAASSGIATAPATAGHPVNIQYAGPVTLTTEEWDAVTGESGGLQPGSTYYVSDTTPGQITFVRPTTTGHFVTQVGIALSTTDLLVQVGPTAQNA